MNSPIEHPTQDIVPTQDDNGINIEDANESNKSNGNIKNINCKLILSILPEKCKPKKKSNKIRKPSLFARFKARLISFFICK